jgi:hypothetical protein
VSTIPVSLSAPSEERILEKQTLFEARSILGTADICFVLARDFPFLQARGVDTSYPLISGGLQLSGALTSLSFGVVRRHEVASLLHQGDIKPYSCRYGGELLSICLISARMPICTTMRGETMRLLPRIDEDPVPHKSDSMEYIRDVVRGIAELFAYAKGYQGVTLMHLPEGCGYHFPLPTSSNHLRIFVGVTPFESEGRSTYPEQLFNERVVSHSEEVGLLLPATSGLGQVYGDGQFDVIQIVDNNVYVLSALSHYREADIATLMRLLVSCFDLIPEYDSDTNSHPHASRPLLQEDEALRLWKAEEELFEQDERQARKKLSQLEAQLIDARRRLEDILMIRRTATLRYRESREMLSACFSVMRAHPLVESMHTVPGVHGFEVDTKTISVRYAGKRYEVGRFRIRLMYVGRYVVYPVQSAHPNGVPHPHITPSGLMCHGTISQSIAEALADMRYADAVLYLLLWLTDGYDPNSLHFGGHHIEEWPTTTE